MLVNTFWCGIKAKRPEAKATELKKVQGRKAKNFKGSLPQLQLKNQIFITMNIQMKTFTKKQAIVELDRIFGEYTITDLVDTKDVLEVYFTTSKGEKLVLLSNSWDYFQKYAPYEIFQSWKFLLSLFINI